MRQYFPKPYEPSGGDINVRINLSIYATKADLKEAAGINTSNFALKSNLASLKTEVDKLDIDILTPVPVNLSKLSDVVKNDVVKKTVYDKLVEKVNNIDTRGSVLKTTYDTGKSYLEKKINNGDKNAKVDEIESKIPNITDLATNSELTAIENIIPNVSSLVKKTDYDAKILDIENKVTNHDHDKYITTSEFNKLTTENFKARLVEDYFK